MFISFLGILNKSALFFPKGAQGYITIQVTVPLPPRGLCHLLGDTVWSQQVTLPAQIPGNKEKYLKKVSFQKKKKRRQRGGGERERKGVRGIEKEREGEGRREGQRESAGETQISEKQFSSRSWTLSLRQQAAELGSDSPSLLSSPSVLFQSLRDHSSFSNSLFYLLPFGLYPHLQLIGDF